MVETPERKFACRLPLIGRHNIYNALAAVGAGIALKVPVLALQAAGILSRRSGFGAEAGRERDVVEGQR
jgi:UDP-N-acetylmuramyl tripeptide synthase